MSQTRQALPRGRSRKAPERPEWSEGGREVRRVGGAMGFRRADVEVQLRCLRRRAGAEEPEGGGGAGTGVFGIRGVPPRAGDQVQLR